MAGSAFAVIQSTMIGLLESIGTVESRCTQSSSVPTTWNTSRLENSTGLEKHEIRILSSDSPTIHMVICRQG